LLRHAGGHERRVPVKQIFDRFAGTTSERAGSPWAFALAVMVLAVWAISGPVFGFSDTWQLIINTGTTIVTFLMVFLLQHTQNKDARALQIKLDALIAASKSASNRMIDVEELDDEDLERIQQRLGQLAGDESSSRDEQKRTTNGAEIN
jgi:low affinity Fe/Cu permease